jgi:hypothetical protein
MTICCLRFICCLRYGPRACWATLAALDCAGDDLDGRIEAQFTALRYFALDGTGHTSHHEQGSMIRRYIIWRNNHAYDERLRRIVTRANVA